MSVSGIAQQMPDTLYIPSIQKKAMNIEVYIDEAHNNFHTKDNRFKPFANVLDQAGYEVKSFTEKFSKESLNKIKVLVVSNALVEGAIGPFVAPTLSAFSKEEVKAVKTWVKKGGSLFLIADHMPFAGASEKLAKAFGFTFYDSFLFDENRRGILNFSNENSLLGKHKIISGSEKYEKIKSIKTFTGQAFEIPDKAISILKTNEKMQVHLPDTMWRFSEKTKNFSAKGLSQGAIMKYGKGKVAFFGEAAMFTAQLAGRNRFKVGMNAEGAEENYKLLLNIMTWLSHKD
ncbi:DUF4350 domain-containing protein [Tenacibaculum sp. S7007]|uniref:DUF4350 domain-containing protein n=1 Tax=Tenacibaculum pelagium TaxID=2759527 RepID=A0A839AL89_9FLAO|nr:DUF4350 domain-containing protein [Tenacibaculum pelagium]MBA6155902.1 DUF4350 domain-containing protein [Tenacibaculum pelagium]